MPSLATDILLRIGTRDSDAVVTPTSFADATPFVAWSLPAGMDQHRFRVLIESVDAGGYAKNNSGIRQSTADHFQYSIPLAITESFRGLCRVSVEIGTTDDGAMQFVSDWVYFVYDPDVESPPTGDYTFEWPAGAASDYHLQIGTDPQFTSDILYENENVPATSGDPLSFTTTFSPSDDTYYFYRVRTNDGGGLFGSWSRTAGIFRSSASTPLISIDDVALVGTASNDVLITFTLDGSESDRFSVEWSFLGGDFIFDAEPMTILNPGTLVRAGTHQIVWRSGSAVEGVDGQITDTPTDVQIYAHAVRQDGVNLITNYGPFTIGGVAVTGGGTPNNFDVSLKLSRLAIRPPDIDVDEDFPVKLNFATDGSEFSNIVPITQGQYIWSNSYTEGTIERRPNGGSGQTHTGGFGSDGQNPAIHWPVPISYQSLNGESSWNSAYGDPEATNRVTPVSNASFLFTSPRDDSLPSTIPAPHASGDRTRMQHFLKGYLNLEGVEVDYPDNYDWTARPSWHRGREVWGTDDAWIQVAVWKFTDHSACSTCGGRGWVASELGPPYDRIDCPNTDCQGGFDLTDPIFRFGNADLKISTMKAFMDVQWQRLTHWLDNKPYTELRRNGMAGGLPPFATIKAHIVGRQVSSLEAVYLPNGDLSHYILNDGTNRRLPPETPLVWDFTGDAAVVGLPSRQPNDWISLRSHIAVNNSGGGDYKDMFPVTSGLTDHAKYDQTDPVSMNIREGMIPFYLGQVDPDSSPIAWNRPRPTQPGSLVIPNTLQRLFLTRNLGFKFIELQANWDSFVTLHFQYTPASNLKVQLQYRQAASILESDWKDIQAANGAIDEATGVWMIPPLTLHAYWDTVNSTTFAEGDQYNLRIRTYNVDTSTFSGWTFSPVITILHNATNPVSVLSATYEPWSREVTVKFRVDDTQADHYTIVRCFYSTADPQSNTPNLWSPIAIGDISGPLGFLSSDRTGRANEHEIIWYSQNYPLGPGNEFRFRIEVVLTSAIEKLTLPFFKWSSPRNPYLDDAEVRLAEVLGSTETQHFDQDSGLWVKTDPPKKIPGEIRLLEAEYENVKKHPGSVSPDGYYSFWEEDPVGSGTYVDDDPAGYQVWLAERYTTGETHGQAMNRVASQIDNLARTVIPESQAVIIEGEKRIRKRLITQGYYAEGHFKAGDVLGTWREAIDAVPVSDRTGDVGMPDTTDRWWRFRVQNKADGGDDIYDADGLYSPKYVTTLEQVWYEVEVDANQTFDSQPHRSPLRTFTYGHTDQRLSIANFYGGQVATTSNTPITGPQQQLVTDPVTGQPLPNQLLNTTTPENRTITTGGALKIKPSLLPGQVAGDVPPPGGAWSGNYYWRVAAYNYFVGSVEARPRAAVTSTSVAGTDLVMNYIAKGHEDITTISIDYIDFLGGGRSVLGYEVSDATTTPFWDQVTYIDFVSDRRAPADDLTRMANGTPWIPKGTNRVQPCVLYDDDLQQYLLLCAKQNNAGQLRVVSARAMLIPTSCEWDVLFEDDASAGMYGPCVIKDGSSFRLYLTVQPTGGFPSYIAVTTSPDADVWESPQQVDGPSSGCSCSCVVKDGVTYHMWYQAASSGQQAIFYATSTDGSTFAVQNAGNPVYTDLADLVRPSVVKMNGVWIMYVTDATVGTVRSVWSADGISWTGMTVELAATTVEVNGSPVAVTPQNAWAFIDLYMGNPELFLAWNYRKEDGTNLMYTARLENRIWRDGVGDQIYGEANNVTDVPCSRDGLAKQLRVNLSENGLPADGSGVKVRLDFAKFSPDVKEYHRQSDWVDVTNAIEAGSYLDPDPWYFDTQLLGFPYMRNRNA